MANPKHLKVLRQGVSAWNDWRKNNPDIKPALRGANLKGDDLQNANLSRADLRGAVLDGSNLTAANLSNANLREAAFRGANLYGAVLRGADLYHVNLNDAILWETEFGDANLEEAIIMWTLFGNNDLSKVRGLDKVRHVGPATIGIDTLYKSGGNIPERFLRGCGVPDSLIAYLPSLIGADQAIQFQSCFISYSHKDEDFTRRLFSKMRDADLRVWFAPEEMKGGRKLHEQIFKAIQLHDKLLLVLSENSLQSEWVTTEIRRARKAEREENRRKLFPIRLVNFETIRGWECFDADSGKDLAVELREYFIPDFSNWQDESAFEAAFDRLLRDLKDTDEPLSQPAVKEGAPIIREFQEIKANILLSTLAHVIAAELKRLKTFLHRHSSLLNRSDVVGFYSTWIAPYEIHFEYGASLDLRQAQYEQMKEQLAMINLQSAPPGESA